MTGSPRTLWCIRGLMVLIFISALLAWWYFPAVHTFIDRSVSAFLALDPH